ncbi:hypothetical protein PSYJYH_000060 [Bacillus phage PSYJ-YH]|nr:hypothetical protein PSYJYH_000060 [Bacillus phage PSYJ-YH]
MRINTSLVDDTTVEKAYEDMTPSEKRAYTLAKKKEEAEEG